MKYPSLLVLSIVSALCFASVTGLSGCMSAEQVRETALAAETATGALGVIQTELEGLKADLAALDLADPDAQETADEILAFITDKTAAANEWMTVLNDANAKLQKAEDGWDVAAAIAGSIATIIPAAGIAVPIINRGKRSFEGVVASVAAGGGPRDSEAARTVMAQYPGLKDRVTATRVKIGDKKMEAVPSKNNA